MEKSIFELIINGEIPSLKVYEDDNFIAILDINPKQKGHTLLIPKLRKTNILEESDFIINSIMSKGIEIAKQIKEKLGATGIKFVMNNGGDAGQEVFHTHLHIIPYYEGEVDKVNNEEVLKEIIE